MQSCLGVGVLVLPSLRRCSSQAARMLWSWNVMKASDRGGCTCRFVGIAVTTHRSHLSSPRDIVSSGAFFDEFGRLHCVRYLQVHFARFQMCVRYGFEASGMESVIASFVLNRSFAKMLLSQPANVPLLRWVVAMVIATRMPRAVRTRACQVGRAFSLSQGVSGSLAKCVVCRLSLHAPCVMCVAALRCAALHQ